MKETKKNITLRNLEAADCQVISDSFSEQGWHKDISQYIEYLQYQNNGQRDIIVAIFNGMIAGYLTIKWKSDYLPFKGKLIPEIVDFNVFKKYQRQGIGYALMDEAEKRIKNVSDFAGIGFGLTRDYGAAQILYIKRKYIPDGKGLVINSTPVKHGDKVIINDDIVFHLIKKLN